MGGYDLCDQSACARSIYLPYILDPSCYGEDRALMSLLQHHTDSASSDDAVPQSLGIAFPSFTSRDELLGLEAKMHLGEVGSEVVNSRLFGDFAREDDLVRRW